MAVLINKALIEIPPKFKNLPPVNPDAEDIGMSSSTGSNARRTSWRGASGLADDIRYYGKWMRDEAFKRIGHLYPKAKLPDGSVATVIAWLWARTVPCPNPACGVQMPLIKTFQLSKKKNNEHWTKPVVDYEAKQVSFVVQNHRDGVPQDGTVDRNGAVCIACHNAVPLSYIREQGRVGNMREKMTAMVAKGDHRRLFVSPTDEHIKAAFSAEPPWRPNGGLPEQARSISVQIYGFTQWHQLFTNRQMTALTTFSDLIEDVHKLVRQDGGSDEYAAAICTYLALVVGRLAASSCSFALWQNLGDFVAQVFTRQGIGMVWDFAEANLFSDSTQNWMGQIQWVAKVVERLPTDTNNGYVYQADASTTIYSKDGPVIVTDPPYYGNIHYADSSDFFYVWMRSTLRNLYPDLFAGILTPKEEEMIESRFRFENPRHRFEELLGRTFRLIRERCNPEFPSSIFYAYKQQEEEREGLTSTGWETMLRAIVSAGFQIVGTWPMRTERPSGVKTGINVLASSVVLVCRPRPGNAPTTTRRQFFDALEQELPAALDQLTREGHIAPTDFAQAAIGPGMKIYSRFSRVETISGEPVSVRDALAAINRAIADFDERQEGDLDSETRFCLDWFKQHGYEEGLYGEAETLALAKNVTIGKLQDVDGLLTAARGRVKLLPLDAFSDKEQLTLGNTTAWKGCFRMAYHLSREDGRGVVGAADVGGEMDGNVETVERLARILYNHYDRKGDSENAVIFNNLVTEWGNIRNAMDEMEQLNFLT